MINTVKSSLFLSEILYKYNFNKLISRVVFFSHDLSFNSFNLSFQYLSSFSFFSLFFNIKSISFK